METRAALWQLKSFMSHATKKIEAKKLYAITYELCETWDRLACCTSMQGYQNSE
jgi:hypothetical protein